MPPATLINLYDGQEDQRENVLIYQGRQTADLQWTSSDRLRINLPAGTVVVSGKRTWNGVTIATELPQEQPKPDAASQLEEKVGEALRP